MEAWTYFSKAIQTAIAGKLHKVDYYSKEDNWEDWEWLDSDTYVYKNGTLSEINGGGYAKYYNNGGRLFKTYYTMEYMTIVE